MTCRPRHRLRGKFHDACPDLDFAHWHVSCRRCAFGWLEPVLFDPAPFEKDVA